MIEVFACVVAIPLDPVDPFVQSMDVTRRPNKPVIVAAPTGPPCPPSLGERSIDSIHASFPNMVRTGNGKDMAITSQASLAKLLQNYSGPVLSHFLETEHVLLAALCPAKKCEPGDIVAPFQNKERTDFIVMIVDGTFKVLAPTTSDPVEVSRIGRGEVFGDICLAMAVPPVSQLECDIAGHVMVITRQAMDSVLESRSASFWREMFEEASHRIENVKPLTKDMTTKGGVQIQEAAAPMPNKKASLNRLVSFARLPSENVALQKAENLDDDGDDDKHSGGHDGLLESLTAHLMKREQYLATVKDGYDITMSSFDEFSMMMQETNLDRDRRATAYIRLKGLWCSIMSGGYCPSFSSKLKGENLMLAGDSVLVTKDFEHVGRYDDLNTGSHWDGVLVEPPVMEAPGETYVEFLIESCSSTGADILIGVCGGSHDPSDGSLAWKQKDGMMFYCNSGYKYCQGKRHEYTPSKPMAKTAHVGDRVGLLVDTWPASRMKPSGQTVTLYINSVSQGVMFSAKGLRQINKTLEWPHTLYFALDLKDPGQRVRLLRNRTFCSLERTQRFQDMTWLKHGRKGAGESCDFTTQNAGGWVRDPAADRSWLDGDDI